MKLFDGITTILFDFDNTLVSLNEEEFITSYAYQLANRFTDVFPNKKDFINSLLAGSNHMITAEGNQTNVMKFFEFFSKLVPKLSYNEVYERFYNFYEREFASIKKVSTTHPVAKKLIEKTNEKFEIVIATNPLFPENAMKNRLKWANLLDFYDSGDIKLISHAELFSTAKPNPLYYLEILKHIKKKPEECLMVGNDFYNDGASSLVGIKFFFISEDKNLRGTDLLSDQTKDTIDSSKIKISDSGTLDDFYKKINEFLSE